MNSNNISKLVFDTRKKLGLTQDKFAQLLGVKRSTVANYEIDKIKPSADVLIHIQELEKQSKAA